MLILPAIDMIGGKAVRLYQGDYAQMTVYNDDPLAVAKEFECAGAQWVHMVDLDGAKTGETPNLETVRRVAQKTKLRVEIGGGIRDLSTAEYGADLTAAVGRGNVLGCQFHPEKSGAVGLNILKAFCEDL